MINDYDQAAEIAQKTMIRFWDSRKTNRKRSA